ncbi:MAG TPA: hypothetical protein VFE78_09530 [Gemmataceae bacterium]|nr:hypothetical protein [Gemmataceae bacterium]
MSDRLLGVDWRPITYTEGKAMTAWVLVLAGVTASDGGLGTGPGGRPCR